MDRSRTGQKCARWRGVPSRLSFIAGSAAAWFGLALIRAAAMGPGHAPEDDTTPVDFNRDVRPILAEHCFTCHGPDARDRKASLRLDQGSGAEGAYRKRSGAAAIAPGSLEDSEVWYRLTTEFEEELMPPPGPHGKGLDPGERDIIRRWILGGAPYEEHWAFVAPEGPAIPGVQDVPWGASWAHAPIDRFVAAALAAEGLAPSVPADRRTLLRRVTLDLTGLPPSRSEVQAFLADGSPDAYERAVDGLLARPQYGEHMARFWLDLVRFADTNGVHHDHYRDLSPYRDWVIRAFNDGLPYDQFVTDQLAGDLVEGATDDQLTASGFHRLHLIIDGGTMLPEESLSRNVTDRVAAFGTAFMGLTLQCAVCHDHKYDPIRQKDFFQLYAFFNNLDGKPETGPRAGADFRRGVQAPYLRFPTERQAEDLGRIDGQIKSARAELAAAAEGSEERDQVQARIKGLNRERDQVETGVRAVMVMRERTEVRPAFLFERGAYDQLGEPVVRDTPAFLPPLSKDVEGAPPTRLDLARWVLAAENPLTARVAVNRFWQQFFGVGLVKTAEDFGTRGEWPRHLELLDHLAVSFRTSGWDVKGLVRRIVTSETYKQSSAAPPVAFEVDPENRSLARGSRFRLDAEVIRDQVLATSGLLSSEMYGKSVKPPQPAGVWEAVTLPDSYPRVFTPDEGEATRRRSVYTFWKRAMPPPQMTILNAPNRESCVARRERTNTPLQALLLMNEGEYLNAARHLAGQALGRGAESAEARVNWLYETITARLPTGPVRASLIAAASDLEAMYLGDPALAAELAGDVPLGEHYGAPELAAWTLVTSAIHNLDMTRTRD